MGCYVNPPTQSKEAWLKQNGVKTDGPCAITESELPVVLVDNGMFTAAGVAFDAHELRAFTYPDDLRFKEWYKVPREKLREVSDLVNYE